MAKATRKKIEFIAPTEAAYDGRQSEAGAVMHMPAQPETPVDTVHADDTATNGVSPDPAPNNAGQQIARPVVTYEIVEARFRTELTRLQYETALQALTSYQITEDNIAEAQNKLVRAKRFLTKFDDIKTKGKEQALAETRMWDKAFNSLKKPLEDEIAVKQKKLNEVAAEQARKKKEADDEEARKNGIKTAIDNFIIDQSQAIAGCTKREELVTIEKMIGSHKGAKTRYAEFLPDLITRSEALTILIKEQKQTIEHLEQLEKDKKVAEEKGDDGALIALEDKKDELIGKIEETKVIVQETAINQAVKGESVEIARPHFNTIGARRTTWKAMLVKKPEGSLDQKELEKAFKAGLLKCEIDPEKTRTVLDTLKSSGSLKDKTEIIVNGIRYYEEKTY